MCIRDSIENLVINVDQLADAEDIEGIFNKAAGNAQKRANLRVGGRGKQRRR
jgi:hypothetical protein